MLTPARIANHPIHPMLVTLPIGLFVFSLICDLISLGANEPRAWIAAALYCMVGGLIGALAAAIPGLIDLLSLKERAVRKIALTHMAINLVVVALYAVNIWLRVGSGDNRGAPLILSIIAVASLAVSGWLGGEMVYVHGVGVTERTTRP
jgi:uncharacterized membrane protein